MNHFVLQEIFREGMEYNSVDEFYFRIHEIERRTNMEIDETRFAKRKNQINTGTFPNKKIKQQF